MRRTLYNDAKAFRTLSPAVRTNGAANGAAVDTRGWRVASLIVVSGAMTDGSVAVTIQDSADGSTGWSNIASTALQGSLPTIADTNDDTVYEVGVIPDPTRPYLRAVATVSGATSGGLTAAVFMLAGGVPTPVARS